MTVTMNVHVILIIWYFIEYFSSIIINQSLITGPLSCIIHGISGAYCFDIIQNEICIICSVTMNLIILIGIS